MYIKLKYVKDKAMKKLIIKWHKSFLKSLLNYFNSKTIIKKKTMVLILSIIIEF